MTFKEQSAIFLEDLEKRNRKPAKPSTLRAYRSYLKNWIVPHIGIEQVEGFGNGAMKAFVRSLVDNKLSSKTVHEITVLVKQIVASVTDSEGNQVHPRTWNNRFIDVPQVERAERRRLTDLDVKHAVEGKNGLFYALLAGTGLRIGEALALRSGNTPGVTSLDLERPLIFVRSQLWERQEIPPKTKAGIREVDLFPSLWERLKAIKAKTGYFLFQNEEGGPMWQTTLRNFNLKPLGIQGFHSFRRYRISRLRELGVPEDIIRYWVGHEGHGITDRYSELAQNRELRAGWAKKAGLGFPLPGVKEQTANE